MDRDPAALLAADAQDAVAMAQLAALPGPLLPWTDFSMRPAAVVAVLAEVIVFGRSRVLECGSGNTTVLLARLLRQREVDGHVVALEHDAAWAALIAEQLGREGLTGMATVRHAPLGADGWYDAALPNDVDLLVVDGPPAYEPGRAAARGPALGRAWDRLAPSCSVVLDDVDRPGEQAVLRAWEAARPLRFERCRGGYAVARR